MKCPACEGEMTKRDSFGVEIDLCPQHGIWLDRGELARIIESFAEQERASDLAAEARKQGRYEGIFLGWASFFMDR